MEASRQLTLLDALRKAAKLVRKQQSLPFYSMREMSDHFGIPLRTVALTYETLEHEGILNRIRGSKTILMGKNLSTRASVRAVVGIPVWLHAFVVSPYSRTVNMEIEERLRESGFVADLIFFRADEACTPDFTMRLLRHNLDKIIWHTPHPHSTDILLSLKDHGVQQVIIQSNETPVTLPFPTYLQDWQPAYQKLAQAWQAAGIRRVLVPDPPYLPSKRALKLFSSAISNHGMEMELVDGSGAAFRRKVFGSRNKPEVGVAFMDHLGADAICNEDPIALEEMMKTFRVAFCRGPIRMPYFNCRSSKVDIVRFSAIEIATRVAQDLKQLEPTPGIIHTFQATYYPQVELNDQTEFL